MKNIKTAFRATAAVSMAAFLAFLTGCASDPAPQVTDQMKQQCLSEYKGQLDKLSQQNGDACWARFGYKFSQN